MEAARGTARRARALGPSVLLLALLAPALAGAHPPAPRFLPHAPILIEGDAQFCVPQGAGWADTGVVNCGEADGSPERPYRIAGWAISAPGYAPCGFAAGVVLGGWKFGAITLVETTRHVLIEDNLLAAAPADHACFEGGNTFIIPQPNAGVFLLHHGGAAEVRRNAASGFANGLALLEVDALVVEHNLLVGNALDGVLVEGSPDAEVRGNLVRGHGEVGLALLGSPGVIVEGNRIQGAGLAGVFLLFSDGGVVRGNQVRGAGTGLELRHTGGALVQGNALVRNGVGILVNQSAAAPGPGTVAQGNLIAHNDLGVLAAVLREPLVLRDNDLEGNALWPGLALPPRALDPAREGVRANHAVDARQNWWGDPGGPRAPGNPGGVGDAAEGPVAYAPWRAEPVGAPSP